MKLQSINFFSDHSNARSVSLVRARVRRKDVNKVADKYCADLDRVVDRATTVLAEGFLDAELLAKRRDQFVAQLHQHETAIQHKASKLKFLIDLHANELLETLGDVRDAGLRKFEAVKSDMEKCHKLTDDFRQYAAEVCS